MNYIDEEIFDFDPVLENEVKDILQDVEELNAFDDLLGEL